MPAIVSNPTAERCLRRILAGEGFALSEAKSHGQTGVDILATREGETWHIEVIGFKSSPSTRAMDFYQSFFRAVSRLNDEARHCVIALPKRFAEGLPARADHHRVAWKRIGEAFPELEIWLVDVEKGGYEKTRWNDWLDKPTGGVVIEEMARLLGTVEEAGRGPGSRKRRPAKGADAHAVTKVEWTSADGKRLRQLRKSLGLTQQELGREVDRTGSRISELERGIISYGRPARPSVELHRRLKSFFGRKGLKL